MRESPPPGALRGALLLAAAAFAAAVMVANISSAAPRPDGAEYTRLATLAEEISRDVHDEASAAELLQIAGLPAAPASEEVSPVLATLLSIVPPAQGAPRLPAAVPLAPAGPAASAQVLDMRLALATLAQSYGSENHKAVVDSRGDLGMSALVLRGGTASLTDLRRLLSLHRLQVEPGPLRVPVIVWHDAGLRLGPGETLEMSRTHGAFLMNFGRLEIDGAHVVATGESNAHIPRYAPFVITAGGGAMQASGARFEGLGFGLTESFSGLSVMSNGLMTERGRSWLRDSRIEGLVSVSISTVSGAEISGNRFHDMRGPGLVMRQTPDARIVANAYTGEAPSNAIRLTDRSIRVRVERNLILGGEQSGIVARSASDDSYMIGNAVWARRGNGVILDRTRCGRVEGNLLLGNTQKGIEIRGGRDAAISGNILIRNRTAGIWVASQESGSSVAILDNALQGNGAGLSTATAGRMLLRGNDFKAQLPRLLGGDISHQSRHIAARFKTGAAEVPLVLTAAGPEPGADFEETCGMEMGQ